MFTSNGKQEVSLLPVAHCSLFLHVNVLKVYSLSWGKSLGSSPCNLSLVSQAYSTVIVRLPRRRPWSKETASWHSPRVQNLINLKEIIYNFYNHCSSKWSGIGVWSLVILGCTIAQTDLMHSHTKAKL